MTIKKRYSKITDFNKNLSEMIAIKKSSIPQAGKGAFAKKTITKGKKIGEYNGLVLGASDYDQLEDKSYVFEVTKKHKGKYYLFYIDAQKGGDLRYVNGANNSKQKKRVNVESYQYAERIFFRASKKILPGEELLTDYGDNYWE